MNNKKSNNNSTINSAFCIAGTSSGDGKTTVTLALLRALYNRGVKVVPFKCGPDYIDPTFHKQACNHHSKNLDCWMMGKNAVIESFKRGSKGMECSVIEGVMGLYDSSQPGSLHGSSAEIAITLGIPVILTVNAKGMAGSIAAMVKGYCEFRKDINIIGVIANKVGSDKHAQLLSEALNLAGLPPLLGYLKRDDRFILPERHLGLVPFTENQKSTEWFDTIANEAESCFEIDKILELTSLDPITDNTISTTIETIEKGLKERSASPKTPKINYPAQRTEILNPIVGIKLGIARDKAFHFYYEDNLEILRNCGFELIDFSPINDKELPKDLKGIYLGGGFPELFAKELEDNLSMRTSIKTFANSGNSIYAECGGYVYLCDSLESDGKIYDMCGLISSKADMGKKMRSLGYREVRSLHDSFLGAKELKMRGHEFHWSSVTSFDDKSMAWNVKTTRKCVKEVKSGYMTKNIIASYIHLHFASNKDAIKNWYQYCIKNVE